MRRTLVAVSILFSLVPSLAFSQSKKLLNRPLMDSTEFSLTVPRAQSLRVGSSYQLKLHVKVRPGWHVFSSKTEHRSHYGGVEPLHISLPPNLEPYLELGSLHEVGKTHVSYDSNFEQNIVSYEKPFDIIVNLRVKKAATERLPLRLLVHFQVCSSRYCMPPRVFEIPMASLRAKPVELRLVPAPKPSEG